jgi:hypothetical protein
MLLSQGSGKAAGIVFSHNSAGNYIRNWRKPVNRMTAPQVAVRDYFSQLAASWTLLTATQRIAWETFGQNTSWLNALGESIKLTGRAWYIKMNAPRLQATVSVISAAPTIFALATLTLPVPTITAAGTTVSLAFTNTDAWANEVGGYLLLYASRAQSPAVNFFAGPYQFAGKVAGAGSPPTTPAVITLPFPSGPTGSHQFFRAFALRADGRPSPAFTFLGTV